MDFAGRAYDHSYRLDPIVRSLLDTDFYKLLMAQFIWERYPNVQTTWTVKNRTSGDPVSSLVSKDEIIEQFEHAGTLRFTQSELIWLRGQTFYGLEGIFRPGFISALRTFQLNQVEYDIEDFARSDYEITFKGPWWQASLWEIPALTIINELRSRAVLKRMGRAELDITFARAKVRLYDKLERLRGLPNLNLTDFGTRRRHSFLWQEHCVRTAQEVLGDSFTGTSNVFLAMKHGLEAKGTNAHELPMTLAALAGGDDEALKKSQYEVLKQWQNVYGGNLLVFLPDTFGTTQFLDGAPHWLVNWTGARPDSKEPVEAGEELIRFWKTHGLTDEQVQEKLVLFSDGLDDDQIVKLSNHFNGRVRVGFGWGTNFTNDFTNTVPGNPTALKPISLVCKVTAANGRPAVKLSDNIEKATGERNEVARYINVFGDEGADRRAVTV
jgi:nicotinate phosphoribosyltransferase